MSRLWRTDAQKDRHVKVEQYSAEAESAKLCSNLLFFGFVFAPFPNFIRSVWLYTQCGFTQSLHTLSNFTSDV